MGDGRGQEALAELHRSIDDRLDELIATVGDLVRIPSLLGDEAPIQQWIARYLSDAGWQPASWDLPDAILELPNAGDSGVPFAGRPNVTATRSGRGGGRSLVLNGHVDVVSPDPVEAWQFDPWGAQIDGTRMYGRGAYDMKSGVGLNLFLARLIAELGIELRGDLHLHSVIEEECTGNGALAAARSVTADAAIVTEPQFGSVNLGHLGVVWFRVHVTGRSAHAGHAWQGVNAIVKTVPIIQALVDLDAELNTRVHPLWEGIHHPINLNIGVISGGDWPSTVPGACSLHCRVSFFPDVDVPEMRETIGSAIAAATAGDPWFAEHPTQIVFDGFQTRGVTLDPAAPLVQTLDAAFAAVTGRHLEHHIATAVNDMRYYIFEGIPATCFGAAGGNAHAADEWLDLESLAPAAKTLAAFIVEWCGVA